MFPSDTITPNYYHKHKFSRRNSPQLERSSIIDRATGNVRKNRISLFSLSLSLPRKREECLFRRSSFDDSPRSINYETRATSADASGALVVTHPVTTTAQDDDGDDDEGGVKEPWKRKNVDIVSTG